MHLHHKVTAYINTATPDQIEILESLRQLIHDCVPGTIEEVKWNMPVFKKEKAFTYFCFFKNHINIGFYNFELLNDPNKLLEGTGKSMRHVKIKSMENMDTKQLAKWLKASVK